MAVEDHAEVSGEPPNGLERFAEQAEVVVEESHEGHHEVARAAPDELRGARGSPRGEVLSLNTGDLEASTRSVQLKKKEKKE